MLDLYFIEGGIGKNIAFTSLLNRFEQPIAVNSFWRKVFKNHSKVAAVYDSLNLFDTEYNNGLLKQLGNLYYPEPYKTDFLRGDKHIIDSFYELCEFEKPEKHETEIIFSEEEIKDIEALTEKLKPFVLVQFTGSDIEIKKDLDEFTTRSLNKKQSQEIINILNFDLKLNVINVTNQKHSFKNTCTVEYPLDYRNFSLLLNYSQSFICIDSFLNHASSNKFCNNKGVVLWHALKSSKMFGYEKNKNIISRAPYFMNFDTKEIIDTYLK